MGQLLCNHARDSQAEITAFTVKTFLQISFTGARYELLPPPCSPVQPPAPPAGAEHGDPRLCSLPPTHLPPRWAGAVPAPLCEGEISQLLRCCLHGGKDLLHQPGQLREVRVPVRDGLPPRLLRGPGDHLPQQVPG